MFFFFKQKTAYEMRISDWSSDVCSSDLIDRNIGVEQHDLTLLRRLRISLVETALPDTQRLHFRAVKRNARLERVTDRIVESRLAVVGNELPAVSELFLGAATFGGHGSSMPVEYQFSRQIGRASCRERVWQYV